MTGTHLASAVEDLLLALAAASTRELASRHVTRALRVLEDMGVRMPVVVRATLDRQTDLS